MEVLIAVLAGVLFAVGLYLLMHRELVRVVVGVVLFTHAANLALLLAGDESWAEIALLPIEHGYARAEANPLTQAMILTAIVIGLGLQMFVLALVRSAVTLTKSQDAVALEESERLEA